MNVSVSSVSTASAGAAPAAHQSTSSNSHQSQQQNPNKSTTTTATILSSSNSNSISPSRRKRHRVVPIIDTAKLLSLDLRSQEPLMNALLSPTSLDLRRRTKLRDVFTTDDGLQFKVNYRSKMKEEMQFQHDIDQLAAEAESAFHIGPIVLPDAVADNKTPNANRVGWLHGAASEDQGQQQQHQSGDESTGQDESDASEGEGEPAASSSSSSTKRSDIERAQLALVQRVRFVQPRSIAPSQLEDVIAATSSIAKSQDVDVGRMMLPSERAKKPSLAELLDQRTVMLEKIDKDRPQYEEMMQRSVDLLEKQKRATEERFQMV